MFDELGKELKGIVKVFYRKKGDADWIHHCTKNNLIVSSGRTLLRDYLNGNVSHQKKSLLTDLLAYWKLDEFSGTTAVDASGVTGGFAQHNGTASNARIFNTVAEGVVFTCADFTSSTGVDKDNIAVTPTGDFYYKPSQFSWVFWVKKESSAVGGLLTNHLEAGNKRSWKIIQNDHRIQMFLSANGFTDDFISVDNILDADVWTHVAITFNAGTVKFFKNGVKVAEETSTVTSLYNNLPNTMWIGKEEDGYGFGFRGKMDEIGLWTRALTEEEVYDTYNYDEALPFPFFGAFTESINAFGVGTGTTPPSINDTDLEAPIVYDGASLIYKEITTYTDDDFKTTTFIGFLTDADITTETDITEIVLCTKPGIAPGKIYCRATFDKITKDNTIELKIEYTQVI